MVQLLIGSGTLASIGYLAKNNTNYGAWTIDRPNGAFGFKDGDGNFGFVNVSWNKTTQALIIKGGKFDNTGNSITVTAVPEPAEYAAALGLGAVGLAFYRKRKGLKQRPKLGCSL